jgi:uncharacterized protein (TIGR02246 family)
MEYPAIVREWVDGWNAHDVERATEHFTEDAVFTSPSVVAMGFGDGVLRGRAAIARQAEAAFRKYPGLRFEIVDVIERRERIVVFYRKWGMYSERPGLTVEVFEVADGKIARSTVYWGVEEVAARFVR